MGTHINAEIRTIMDSLRRIVQILRMSSRNAEAKVGMSGAQLFVLSQLRDGVQLSVNELAERTATHQSSVSVVVNRLVRQRLIRRTQSSSDGRRRVLELTPTGQRVLRTAPDAAQEQLISGLHRMKTADRRMLAVSIADWASRVIQDRSPATMFEEQPVRKGGRRG